MKLREVLDFVEKMKPGNPYDTATKIQWLNELEGDIQSRLLNTAPQEIIQYTEQDMDETLLIPTPFDRVYWPWVAAMIEFANGEYSKYQNTLQLVNDAYDKYAKWFHRKFHQDTGDFLYIGGTTKYGLSAYEIAVNHGFDGTEEEWLVSLEGREGPPGPVGEGLNIVDQLGSEAELPDTDNLKPGTGYLVGKDADALLFIWNGEEWFFKKSLRGAAGYTPQFGVDYWKPEEQQAVANATGNANAAASEARAAADASNAAANAATTAASNAETAADHANTATGNANQAAQSANTAEQAAGTAAGMANAAAENASKAASAANTAAGNANQAAETTNAAVEAANAAAQSASNAETELRNAAAAGAFDGDTGPAGVVYGPDEPTDPSHPVWIDTSGNDENPYLMADQGVENAGKILGIGEDGKAVPVDAPEGGGSEVPGENGGYYTPSVAKIDKDTVRLSFAPNKTDMPAVADVDVELPEGPAGHTPALGVDYWTPEEQQVVADAVGAANAAAQSAANAEAELRNAAAAGDFDGKDGSDATVTAENIQAALGYTPADEAAVGQLSAEKADKITGAAGQVVGFDEEGNMVAVTPKYPVITQDGTVLMIE